jgi:regulator of protease activity HflC (stomatin/prohibitin superfamily)
MHEAPLIDWIKSMSEPSGLPSRFKKLYWTIGVGVMCAAAVAPWLMTKVIETEPGYNTVVVHAPLMGEYTYEKEVLPPGRNLVWAFDFGIPVKMGEDTSLVSSDEVATKDGKTIVVMAKVKVRVTDAYALISGFGEQWHKDTALPVMQEALEWYARNQNIEVFEQALKGSGQASFKLLSDIQDDFNERDFPLEVQNVTIDYVGLPKNSARYVLDANAKKWVHDPRLSLSR